MPRDRATRSSIPAAVTTALLLALLSGCGCCDGPPGATLHYVIDPATARQITHGLPADHIPNRDDCQPVCDLLAGRTDTHGADAHLPDAGVHPGVPLRGCRLMPGGDAWGIACDYEEPCAR